MLKASFITHEFEFLNNNLFRQNVAPQMKELHDEFLLQGVKCSTFDVESPELADFIVVNRLDLVFGQVLKVLHKNPKTKLVLFALEEPLICGLHESDILTCLDVDAVFSWRDDLSSIPHFTKINIPQSSAVLTSTTQRLFADRKLLVAIDGFKTSRHPNEAYSKRREILRGLAKAGLDIDLFGRGWEKCKDTILTSLWRGAIEVKYEFQCKYIFTLCIQNAKGYPGDICEKIFDAFKAGTIPIYHGAPNISDHVPSNCFIDLNKFDSTESLAKFILQFSEADYYQMQAHIAAFMDQGFKEQFTSAAVARRMVPKLLQLKAEHTKNRHYLAWFIKLLFVVFRSLIAAPRISKWRALFEIGRSFFRVR